MNSTIQLAAEDPSQPCYLYMLTHCDGGTFKIGVANDIPARAVAFSQQVDYARSWAAKGTRAACYRAEGVLHRLLHRFRRRLDGDGGTEWFSMDCSDRAQTLFDILREDIGIGPLMTIAPPHDAVRQNNHAPISREERVRRREARRREIIQTEYEKNAQHIAVLERAAATIIERAQVRRYRAASTGGSLFVRGTKEALDATRTLLEYGGFGFENGGLNVFGLLRIRERRGEHALGFVKLTVIWHHINMQDAIFTADIRDRLVGVFETLFSERLGHLLPDATAA
ncbi:GIY-YIG nuclease family protein [Burkholderia ubonensis]|uniref:GIY-YIG nuclease family protein n=1 Tax=Burkholderia ubonensis TaxID=101571 RepID=UPI0012F992A5|nr:GIY-YIG nuclease family protein [Burkholderia ubonensis]